MRNSTADSRTTLCVIARCAALAVATFAAAVGATTSAFAADASTGPRVEPVLGELTAAWTWPHRPTAIRHVGTHDKTYFGFVTNTGGAYIASYDHRRDEYQETFLRQHPNNSDHAQTIVHLRPDGRLYLFCRRRAAEGEPGDRVWGVSISEDDGETFVHQSRPLLAGKGVNSPYTIMKGNGTDTIHFARSDWMSGQQSFVRKDIYAFYFQRGAFYRYDGSRIRNWDELPLDDPGELDLVYQTEPDNDYAFIRDLALIDGQRPALVFTTLERAGHDERERLYQGSGRNWYHYAEWDGERWTDPEVVTEAGGNRTEQVPPETTQPAYDGMIMLNHENPHEVVLGRELPPLHSKQFVIELWSRLEDGAWRKKHSVSELDPEQPSKVFKAYIPWNHHPEFKVLWLGGPYEGITDWSSRIYRTAGEFPD